MTNKFSVLNNVIDRLLKEKWLISTRHSEHKLVIHALTNVEFVDIISGLLSSAPSTDSSVQ